MSTDISKRSFLEGLELVSSGKVRDTYRLGLSEAGEPLLLVVASDRISIFDFVLNALVPMKGEVLTAMNIFWKTQVFQDVSTDLVAYGMKIDSYLPREMKGDRALQRRAVVVRQLEMLPIECIARGYLTGSGWKAYRATSPHMVCGHLLPDGLTDGSKLPEDLFTPTTKAKEGHDKHITASYVREKYGEDPEDLSLYLYSRACEYAVQQGILIADTKFEMGRSKAGHLCLGDEAMTPDSSRFWDGRQWHVARAQEKSPEPHDKQIVRNWGKEVGIDLRDPLIPQDRVWVSQQVPPQDVLNQTQRVYENIFKRLTGMSLIFFQRRHMDIPVCE